MVELARQRFTTKSNENVLFAVSHAGCFDQDEMERLCKLLRCPVGGISQGFDLVGALTRYWPYSTHRTALASIVCGSLLYDNDIGKTITVRIFNYGAIRWDITRKQIQDVSGSSSH